MAIKPKNNIQSSRPSDIGKSKASEVNKPINNSPAKSGTTNTQSVKESSQQRKSLFDQATAAASDGDATEALMKQQARKTERDSTKTKSKSLLQQSMDEAKDGDADEVTKKKNTKKKDTETDEKEARIKRQVSQTTADQNDADSNEPVKLSRLERLRERKRAETKETEASENILDKTSNPKSDTIKFSGKKPVPQPGAKMQAFASQLLYEKEAEMGKIFSSNLFKAAPQRLEVLRGQEEKKLQDSSYV